MHPNFPPVLLLPFLFIAIFDNARKTKIAANYDSIM